MIASFFCGVALAHWVHNRNRPPGVLSYRESREFERKIAEGLKHPVGLVPTPKLPKGRG